MFQRCQQIIPLKVSVDKLLLITAIRRSIHQPQHLTVLDLTPEQRLYNLVIDRGEILLNIGLQQVTITRLKSLNRSMAAWVPLPGRQA
jgi:hypothetical protein